METVKEKLAKLLTESRLKPVRLEGRKLIRPASSVEIADHLIQNGVTFATDTEKLIEWLKGEKYTCVDENSREMTEEFENQHKWELSRNCFINKVIKHLEDATDTNAGDKWVSVDEPPKEDGKYLVLLEQGGMIDAKYEKRRGGFGDYHEDWTEDGLVHTWVPFKIVAHWMPLPQPPKGVN